MRLGACRSGSVKCIWEIPGEITIKPHQLMRQIHCQAGCKKGPCVQNTILRGEIMMVKKLLKFSLVFLLLVVIPSCSRSRPVLNLKNEPLPTLSDGSTYTKEQVRKAIFEGCRRRGWVAQPKEEGLIEASIIVRANRAKIEIRYDETNISILYKDSYNLS